VLTATKLRKAKSFIVNYCDRLVSTQEYHIFVKNWRMTFLCRRRRIVRSLRFQLRGFLNSVFPYSNRPVLHRRRMITRDPPQHMYVISVSSSLTCLLLLTQKNRTNTIKSTTVRHLQYEQSRSWTLDFASLHMRTPWLLCVVICPNFDPYNTSKFYMEILNTKKSGTSKQCPICSIPSWSMHFLDFINTIDHFCYDVTCAKVSGSCSK